MQNNYMVHNNEYFSLMNYIENRKEIVKNKLNNFKQIPS